MRPFIRLLSFGLALLILTPFARGAAFSDVASNHPHYDAIMYLEENGIVEGYADHTFRPEQAVNRAEALKILLLGSDILVPEIQAQEIFPDVVHDAWYGKYVAKAKNLKIVSGDADTGFFRPGDTVNLAEALKMILETNDIETAAPSGHPYADVPPEAWFAPYFEYARSVSLLDQTSSEDVEPAMPVNRGMLAELMYRMALKPRGYAEGKASYYGEKFHGRTTASGDVFDASGFTAAHRTYPFGTWLKVTNLENNQSVVVKVNDRGPYVADRIIDLSKAAFEAIAPLSRGVINVSVSPTSAPSGTSEKSPEDLSASLLNAQSSCPEKDDLGYISSSAFENVTLDAKIPDQALLNEVLTLKGHIAGNSQVVSAFITDKNEKQLSFTAPVVNQAFTVNIHFPSTGTFNLGVLPGESGSSIVKEIDVLPDNCVDESSDSNLPALSGLSADIEDGKTVFNWSRRSYELTEIKFTQGSRQKRYLVYNTNTFTPYYPDFESFKEGQTEVTIRGAKIDEGSLLEDDHVIWSAPSSLTFNAAQHNNYHVDLNEVSVLSLPSTLSTNQAIEIRFEPEVNIKAQAALILPSGQVKEVALTSPTHEASKNANGVDVFKPSGQTLSFSYTPTENKVHIVEVNNENGLAAINIPLYPQGQYPLLPNLTDLTAHQEPDVGNDLGALRNEMLNLVNQDRKDHGLAPLVLDSKLSNLAQHRSDDLVRNNYFSHWDSQGRSANDIRKNYAITQVVAENLAQDTSVESAQYGLMQSAAHRASLLSDEWTRIGFGITKKADGSAVFVHIYSADPLNLEDVGALRQEILTTINDQRAPDLILQNNLNTLAQNWSDSMVSRDFFDFSAPNGDTLVESIRGAGVNASLGTYIVGNTNFQDALDQIAGNNQLTEIQWKNLGIGVSQDSFGVIKITLIYTE